MTSEIRLFIAGSVPGVAVSGNSGDDAGAGGNAPDAVVDLVGNVDVSIRVNSNSAGIDLGLGRGSTVAAISLKACTGKHGDPPGAGINPADRIGNAFDEVDIAIRVCGNVQEIADAGMNGGAAVAGRKPRSVARHGGDLLRPEIDAPDAVIVNIGNI